MKSQTKKSDQTIGKKSSNNVKFFYDNLASDYHLIFQDWRSTIQTQSTIFDNIIKKYNKIELNSNRDTISILDCACGIGTQAIGLALKGYKVSATDLSLNSVKRAQYEAYQRYNLSKKEIQFSLANFCNLKQLTQAHFDEFEIERGKTTQTNSSKNDDLELKFDIVVACDNALPHLLNNEDVKRALLSMKSKLKKNGMLILTTRDYDTILDTKPLKAGDLPKTYIRNIKQVGHDDLKLQQITFQTWDWSKCKDHYRLNHWIMIEKLASKNEYDNEADKEKDQDNISGDSDMKFQETSEDTDKLNSIEFETPDASTCDWDVRHRATIYYALRRKTLLNLIKDAGFSNGKCINPSESGFYQPVFVAWY